MKLYSCHTPSHRRLFEEYFLKSLASTVGHVSHVLDIQGCGDFQSADFLETLRTKIRLIIESVGENRGSVIVWSDVDILFIRDFTASVQRVFDQDREIDIVFQKEFRVGDAVNCGFIAMRCNDRVKAFYEKVSDLMAVRRNQNEQQIINELLSKQDLLRWTQLPLSFYARSHGWPPPDDIVLYHANCSAGVDGVGQKERQFNKFAKHLRWRDAHPVVRLLQSPRKEWRRLVSAYSSRSR